MKDSTNQKLNISTSGGVYSVRVFENGCFSEAAFFVLTANEPNKKDIIIKLYPNPNAGTFWIDIPEMQNSWQMDIYDVLGRNIFSKSHKNKTQNIEQITVKAISGIYVLKLSNQNGSQSIKFVID